MTAAEQLLDALESRIGQVVFGADTLLHHLAIGLICRGHVLLQGPPGLGKTLLARSLAAVLGGQFGRIQGTADLMPSDLTGVHVFHAQHGRFELVRGPLFADVVLFDEVNRAGPKTQSALLQAMEERSITIDREVYALSPDLLVAATQNPHEFEGTYPLPESQLDRFLLRLELDYPDTAVEQQVLRAYDRPDRDYREPLENLTVLPAAAVAAARTQSAAVHVADTLYDYVCAVAQASRRHPQVALGLSTRGLLGLIRCARVETALRAGAFVTPDDVKTVAPAVIAHRLVLSAEAQIEGVQAGQLVSQILHQVPVPRA
ncbi:MAG: AAA family ATPase [Gammaproteobacteria bacterium]